MKMLSLFFLTLFVLAGTTIAAESVPTMSKDELKTLLGSPDLVVLDVRQGKDWSGSDLKIKDAVRIENGDLSPVENYRKESTFVVYCA